VRRNIFKIYSKKEGYYKAPNALTQNEQLSYEARGVLLDILSRGEGWDFSMHNMIQPYCKQTMISRIFHELEQNGYICCWTLRGQGKIIGKYWVACEFPVTKEEFKEFILTDKTLDFSQIFLL